MDDIALEMNHWLVRVTATPADGRAYLDKVAGRYEVDPDILARSPSVLVGTAEACIDMLVERRETFGFTHFQLDAGYPPKDLDGLAPILNALSDH
jgi:hypothetical protein